MRLKTRLTRLERAELADDPNVPPPFLWEVLWGVKNTDNLPAADRSRIEGWWEGRREEGRRCRIAATQRLVDLMRTEFTLGVSVQTAEELVQREDRERGFYVIEELLRLVESPPLAEESPTFPSLPTPARER